jgi:hypothetical protein
MSANRTPFTAAVLRAGRHHLTRPTGTDLIDPPLLMQETAVMNATAGNIVPMHSTVEYLFSTLNLCILKVKPDDYQVQLV